MSKTVDLVLEEFATFTRLLTFQEIVREKKAINPVSGEEVLVTTRKSINVLDYDFFANIVDSYGNIISSFILTILDSSSGMVTLGMTKEVVSSLVTKVDWCINYGTASQRVGVLGRYDILAISKKSGTSTRVMQGRCLFSAGATNFSSPLVNRNIYIIRSPLTYFNKEVVVKLDEGKPHGYLGIQYFASNNTRVVPTSGTLSVYLKSATTNKYKDTPDFIIDARDVKAEVSWNNNASEVKVVPNNLKGVSSYRVNAICNRS